MELRSRQRALLNGALLWLGLASSLLLAQAAPSASANPSPSGTAAVLKQLGSIREIHGSRLLLVTDQGEELSVEVQPGARLLRLPPGQTDLKNATTIQLPELQVGDRVLVRGTPGADGKVLSAASVLVMKQQDIAHRKQEEMLDWQRRGVGGLVQQVDAQSATVALSVAAASGASASAKTLAVHATPKTTYRRYAPNSMKWEEATASQFGEIRVGDQLRARGSRSDDGRQLEAEEMVFGSFRNIAGLITSIDSAQGTLTVEDLATKKPVTVQITTDSKMRKLPPQMAQGLAMRLRGEGASPAEQEGAPGPGMPTAGMPTPGMPAPGARPRSGDLNQMLARLPAATLSEFQKAEAVMIVSTAGSRPSTAKSGAPEAAEGGLPQAIIVLGGAEPVLRANPSGRSTEGLLTPWSLAAPGGEQP